MKNISLILASLLLISGNVCLAAENPAERLIAFRTMEKGHKAEWLEHMKKLHNDKYNLLIEIHNEWFDYGNENTRAWENNTDWSLEGKEKIFANELERAVELHKKHLEQWKNLREQHREEALEIHARHEKELEDFLAPAKEAAEEKAEEIVEELKQFGEELKERMSEDEAAVGA